jgi:hypothetical protein
VTLAELERELESLKIRVQKLEAAAEGFRSMPALSPGPS